MVDRDPEKFLSDLNKAFHNRPEIDTTLKPQYLFFFAAKSAVAVRLTNLDSLTEKFPQASKNVATDLMKRLEQNQVLFDFFANAAAAFESFCSCSYFVGAALDPGSFSFAVPDQGRLTRLRQISPASALKSFQIFAPSSAFTEQLAQCLESKMNTQIKKMRNLLVHRIVPGSTIRLSTHSDLPHLIDLDLWFEGDLTRIYGGTGLPEPECVFELDNQCLARIREWLDAVIDGLSTQLTKLADSKGLR